MAGDLADWTDLYGYEKRKKPNGTRMETDFRAGLRRIGESVMSKEYGEGGRKTEVRGQRKRRSPIGHGWGRILKQDLN